MWWFWGCTLSPVQRTSLESVLHGESYQEAQAHAQVCSGFAANGIHTSAPLCWPVNSWGAARHGCVPKCKPVALSLSLPIVHCRHGQQRRAWCSLRRMMTRTSWPARWGGAAGQQALDGAGGCWGGGADVGARIGRDNLAHCWAPLAEKSAGDPRPANRRPSPSLLDESPAPRPTLPLQGTIGNEILRETDMDKLDAIFVAVGEMS